MKVLVLNGSMRKQNTHKLLASVIQEFSEFDVEYVHIKDFELKPCTGCESCLKTGTCHINDDASLLLGKIASADGIVIGSPIHLRQISGYLKVLIDRACEWYHRSPLVGKPILFATTTQVTGARRANKYFKDLSLQWGTIYCGEIDRNRFNSDKAISLRPIKKMKKYLTKGNRNYFPSLKQLFEFSTQKVLALNVLPKDKEYWLKKGYATSHYYYPCRISPTKRSISYLYYKFLDKIISSNK